jgi:hypothetical protein
MLEASLMQRLLRLWIIITGETILQPQDRGLSDAELRKLLIIITGERILYSLKLEASLMKSLQRLWIIITGETMTQPQGRSLSDVEAAEVVDYHNTGERLLYSRKQEAFLMPRLQRWRIIITGERMMQP